LPSTRAQIHAPWSASKVATALRCPRLFHFRYVEKLPEPEVMPEARIGKAVHAALELALQGTPVAEAAATARGALADDQERSRFDQLTTAIEPFTTRVAQFRRRRRVQRQLVEYSLAIREDVSPTSFYAADAYYRGIIDVGYLFDDETLAIVDHKTGLRYPQARIGDQMDGYAVLAWASFRAARRVWLGVHWVAERAVEWAPRLEPARITDALVPELLDNIEAAALAVSDGPRTNPGPYCERCAYRELCPASRQQRYDAIELDELQDDD
jgi:RecB family exonuclease